MNHSQEQSNSAGQAGEDSNRTVVGVPQHLVHDALAFYEDSADSTELNELEAFDQLEAALQAENEREEPVDVLPIDERSAMVTQPLPQRAEPPATYIPSRGAGNEEETSIEDYMANLLQRVNGGAMSPPKSSNQAPPLPKPVGQPQGSKPAGAARPETADQREVKPPPESREGLSNMRELANMTARSAIDGLLADHTPITARGRTQATFSAAHTAGAFLGATGAGLLYTIDPGRPFLIHGLLCLILAAALLAPALARIFSTRLVQAEPSAPDTA